MEKGHSKLRISLETFETEIEEMNKNFKEKEIMPTSINIESNNKINDKIETSKVFKSILKKIEKKKYPNY